MYEQLRRKKFGDCVLEAARAEEKKENEENKKRVRKSFKEVFFREARKRGYLKERQQERKKTVRRKLHIKLNFSDEKVV